MEVHHAVRATRSAEQWIMNGGSWKKKENRVPNTTSRGGTQEPQCSKLLHAANPSVDDGKELTSPSTEDSTYSHCTDDSSSVTSFSEIPTGHVRSIQEAFGADADLYLDVLQVCRGSANRHIRIAYFRRGREVLGHQDRNVPCADSPPAPDLSEAAKKRFLAVTMAYEILSNPIWRDAYERSLVTGEWKMAAAHDVEEKTRGNGNNNDTVSVASAKSTPILRRTSEGITTRLNDRSTARTSSVRWNEEVEELWYSEDPDETRFKVEELGCPDHGCGGDETRHQGSKSKKKKKKKRIVLDTRELRKHLETAEKQKIIPRAFVSDLLDELEASLDGLDMSLSGLVQFTMGETDSTSTNEAIGAESYIEAEAGDEEEEEEEEDVDVDVDADMGFKPFADLSNSPSHSAAVDNPQFNTREWELLSEVPAEREEGGDAFSEAAFDPFADLSSDGCNTFETQRLLVDDCEDSSSCSILDGERKERGPQKISREIPSSKAARTTVAGAGVDVIDTAAGTDIITVSTMSTSDKLRTTLSSIGYERLDRLPVEDAMPNYAMPSDAIPTKADPHDHDVIVSRTQSCISSLTENVSVRTEENGPAVERAVETDDTGHPGDNGLSSSAESVASSPGFFFSFFEDLTKCGSAQGWEMTRRVLEDTIALPEDQVQGMLDVLQKELGRPTPDILPS